jgi:polysaccharide deacetylase family protein (PEP-CTERM system associated)
MSGPADAIRDDRPPIVLTVDVEDYFMSPETIAPERWPDYPPRIREAMGATLDLLGRFGARATFFFLGWVAERFPDLVQETVRRGHEIGTHLYDHRFAHDQTPVQFRAGLERSLEVLRTAGVSTVVSHRAPGFSLSRDSLWQFEALAEAGIRYDSSINPYKTYLYGEMGAPRFPYRIGRILEWPPATVRIASRVLPVGGGGTLRILPGWYCRWARRRYSAEGWPPMIYFHPWELDPSPPQVQLPLQQKIIHHFGLGGFGRKIVRLLQEHRALTLAEAGTVWGGPDLLLNISQVN